MFVRVIYSVSTGVRCDTNAALLWASFLVESGPTSYATGTWMWWFRFWLFYRHALVVQYSRAGLLQRCNARAFLMLLPFV